MTHKLYNHKTGTLSELDLEMVRSVPEGGNWKNIPETIPSKRLEQIRKSGGRTTYYGRLSWNKPSYTVTTYFNRPGNGCFIHPDDGSINTPQHRLLSYREAARLQSFPDCFRFYGTKTSMYKQIGNAVPPLLAYALAKNFNVKNAIDLFCGCGGLSYGFEMAGVNIIAGNDIEKHFMETWRNNHSGTPVIGNISDQSVKNKICELALKNNVDIIIGGPPCQGFSTAGWRQAEDPRNSLWKDYLDIVSTVRPKFFLIENVTGLLSTSHKGQPVFENMQQAFGALGYSLQHKKICSEDYGVPQLRRRIFIVGTHSSAKETFMFPERYTKIPVTVSEAIQSLPPLSSNDGSDEIIISSYQAQNIYEKWLIGKANVEDLIEWLRSR